MPASAVPALAVDDAVDDALAELSDDALVATVEQAADRADREDGAAAPKMTALPERGWWKVRLDGEEAVRSCRRPKLAPLDEESAAPAPPAPAAAAPAAPLGASSYRRSTAAATA